MRILILITIIIIVLFIFPIFYSFFYLQKSALLNKKTYIGLKNEGRGSSFLLFATGDSVGAGVGASTFETSVVGRIVMEIAKKRKVVLVNNSVSGNKIEDLLEVELPNEKQNLILLIVGSNNLFRFTDLNQFRKNTKKVLDLYSPLSDKIIIVGPGRIFDADAVPYFLKPIYRYFAPKYAEIIAQEATKYKNVIHVNPINTKLNENEYGFTGAEDHFHPNDEGHRFWFDLIKPHL